MRIPDLDTGQPATFANSNGVTFGTNGQTITASVNTAGVTGVNVAAGTQTASSGTVVFSNSNNVTFGMSGSSQVTASMSYAPTISFWINVSGSATSSATNNQSSIHFFPIGIGNPFPGLMTINTFQMLMSCTSVITSKAGTWGFSFGLYTNNAGTLSLLNSVGTSITWGAVSNISTGISGLRWFTVHSSQWSVQPALSQTNYWMGFLCQSSSQTQGFAYVMEAIYATNARWGTVGVNQSSASSQGWFPFLGAYSTSTAALPVLVNQADVSCNVNMAGAEPVICFNNIGAF